MKIFITVLILFFSFANLNLFSQSEIDNKNYLWKVGLHTGSSMLWGDLSDDSDPFTKMFSKQSKLSFEIDLNRKITNTFSVQGSFLFGNLSGERTKWSDDQLAGLGFKTNYFDYSLALNVDLTSIFWRNPDRLINVYVLAGAGMVHYSANSFTTPNNVDFNKVDEKAFFVPWGWGMGFNLTPRLTLFAQNTFRHGFIDDLDAHIGSGSEVDDIYSFTSIGASYKFGPKKERKEKIEIVPVKPDTSTIVAEYQPIDVNTQITMPLVINNEETKNVSVTINKGDLTNSGEFNQSYPDGFMIEPLDLANGQMTYEVGKLTIKWENLPSAETINFSYKIKTSSIDAKTYSIPGSFAYTEENQIKVKQFKNQIIVESTTPIATNEVPNQPNDNISKPVEQIKTEPTSSQTTKVISGITYGVQVAAVYGGKMNPMALQKQYKLNETVNESSYQGYSNYTIGNYTDIQEAEARRKGTNVRGSYIVAFKDGVYQPHLYYINQDVMDKSPFNANGITYKIQILANNGRPYAIVKTAAKFNIEAGSIYEEKTGNWYQYTTGKFSSMEEAKAYLQEMKASGATDAYIIKYENGKRI
ncbi:MAG: outer membrane beta-barrel protein [Bacteroidales bacterium]|nr:outer membrane beta-barrel protein [Bacteroidales bacterium]